MAARAWETVGGYLRGAALLGFVEGVAMGITLALVGAKLAAPVALVTFITAFVPFVGAIVSGVVAVLVALATGGVDAAAVVAAVAAVTVVIQQFDNDLLAPLVYGRALNLHPVVVLLAITAGGALFGLAGSILAVPVTAVVVNVAGAGVTCPFRREVEQYRVAGAHLTQTGTGGRKGVGCDTGWWATFELSRGGA